MNPVELSTTAGLAVLNFRKHHETACVVYFRDGMVCCCPTREATVNSPRCLIFTRIQQKHGLSSAGWTRVGRALFIQQIKEKACQAHQKL